MVELLWALPSLFLRGVVLAGGGGEAVAAWGLALGVLRHEVFFPYFV